MTKLEPSNESVDEPTPFEDPDPIEVPKTVPASSAGLGQRAARGALITFGGQFSRILIQLVSVVVLARLLTPHAYGVVAMVLTVVGIGEIFRDFGLSSAAIQAKTLSKGQRNNLFWMNTGIGVILASIVFFGAGVIAAIYHEPSLEPLARAISLTFLMNGLATQFRADLNRRFKFFFLSTGDVVSLAVGLTAAIIAALMGLGEWALVIQQLVQYFTLLVLLVSFAHWIPGLPDRTAPMRGFIRFGGHLVVTQLISYAANNVDSLTIGIRFGATQLGIYNRSFQLLMTPLNQLRTPTTTVALPVLSRLVDDTKKYGDFLARGQLVLGYTLAGVLGIVAGAAKPITDVMLGTQWTEVSPILRLLAIAGIFQTLAFVGYWVYLSRALTKDLMQYTIITAVIKVICIVSGAQWGVIGVATGYMIAPAIAWPLSLWWLSRRSPIPLKRLVLGAVRVLAVALGGGIAALAAADLLRGTPHFVAFVGSIGAGGIVYLAILWLVPVFKKDALAVIDIVRIVLKNRRLKVTQTQG